MSRYSGNSSYNHSIKRCGHDWYRISWTYDRYYKNCRLSHPQRQHRDTDYRGALRFAERWGCRMPLEPEDAS